MEGVEGGGADGSDRVASSDDREASVEEEFDFIASFEFSILQRRDSGTQNQRGWVWKEKTERGG